MPFSSQKIYIINRHSQYSSFEAEKLVIGDNNLFGRFPLLRNIQIHFGDSFHKAIVQLEIRRQFVEMTLIVFNSVVVNLSPHAFEMESDRVSLFPFENNSNRWVPGGEWFDFIE